MDNKNTVTLINNSTGEKFDFNLIECTRGPKAIDFGKLFETTGIFSYDPGYASTAGCKSTVSYIDGQNGVLLYRGIPLQDLVEKYTFTDICSLLISGNLPKDDKESKEFELELRSLRYLNEGLINIFKAFPDNAHPMANLSSAVAALSTFYRGYMEIGNDYDYQMMAKRMIAKIPTLVAFSYRNSIGYPIVYPDVSLSYVENFLRMLRAFPDGKLKYTLDGEVQIDPLEVEALDKIFTLHAEHGQNASTTTVRNVASTGVHPYAAISAGINALWGPSHGGANEKVLDQLAEIGDVKNVDKFIQRAKDKNDPFRLMGFGHRVYKNYDPRAKVLKKLKDDLAKKGIKINDRFSDIAEKVEEVALTDDYFIERKLYPNVDFYSGIILSALKIPVSLFTPIFVIGRMPGWCAHVIEHIKSGARITRPRQVYEGK